MPASKKVLRSVIRLRHAPCLPLIDACLNGKYLFLLMLSTGAASLPLHFPPYMDTKSRRLSHGDVAIRHAPERSKEELELAEELLNHSQVGRVSGTSRSDDNRHLQGAPSVNQSEILSYQSRDYTPKVESSFESPASSQSHVSNNDFLVTGQVCRYYRNSRFSTANVGRLTSAATVAQHEHRSGAARRMVQLFATHAAYTKKRETPHGL